MPASSLASASRPRDPYSKDPNAKTPLLDSHRKSALLGFLLSVVGLLLLLGLVSDLPGDPSLDTAGADGPSVRNWVGLAGSYSADAPFPFFCWVAYLLPFTLLLFARRLLIGRP